MLLHSAFIRGRIWGPAAKRARLRPTTVLSWIKSGCFAITAKPRNTSMIWKVTTVRLDAIQAGILRIKLRHLASWNERRRKCAARYQQLFGETEERINLPFEPSWSKAVFHLYVVQIRNREALQNHLGKAGIGTGIHYPVPLHLQKAYQDLGYRLGDFPVSENAASQILSLPMFPGLTYDQQERIAQTVLEFVEAETRSKATVSSRLEKSPSLVGERT